MVTTHVGTDAITSGVCPPVPIGTAGFDGGGDGGQGDGGVEGARGGDWGGGGGNGDGGGNGGSSGGSAVSRSSSSLEPAAAEAAKVDMACWWYSASGQQQGPVTGAQLAAMLTRGEVTLKTWVFEVGRADWEQLSNAQPRLPQL